MVCSDVRYCMQFADGQSWHIVPNNGAESWVAKFAAVLELEASRAHDSPKLIVTQGGSSGTGVEGPVDGLDLSLREYLPENGWTPQDLQVLRFWTNRDVPDVICEIGNERNRDLDTARMMEALHPIYQRTTENWGVPFHAGLVEWNGLGILLAGPGKTGKSTCCRRVPAPWRALCDDETLIVRDEQKRYCAHPMPTWSILFRRHAEKTWNVQQHVPLKAMFFLDQAESDEAVPLGRGEASVLTIQSIKQMCCLIYKFRGSQEERLFKRRLFDNACELAKTIPAFTLRVSLTGQFWKEIEKALLELPDVTVPETPPTSQV